MSDWDDDNLFEELFGEITGNNQPVPAAEIPLLIHSLIFGLIGSLLATLTFMAGWAVFGRWEGGFGLLLVLLLIVLLAAAGIRKAKHL